MWVSPDKLYFRLSDESGGDESTFISIVDLKKALLSACGDRFDYAYFKLLEFELEDLIEELEIFAEHSEDLREKHEAEIEKARSPKSDKFTQVYNFS